MPAPYDVLILGAGPGGILAAKAAGVPVIAVSWGYARCPVADMAPDAVAPSMQSIHVLVARLASASSIRSDT